MHQIQKDLDKAVAHFTCLVDSEKATAEDLVHHSRTIEPPVAQILGARCWDGGLAPPEPSPTPASPISTARRSSPSARARDAELLDPSLEGRGLHHEQLGCSTITAHHPIGLFERPQDVIALDLLQGLETLCGILPRA